MKIGIIDYGVGNLKSITNALLPFGVDCIISSDTRVLTKTDGLILPGDGAAGRGMENLKKGGLDNFVKNQILIGKPFLGICLGMQLLLTYSEEGEVFCLNVIPGIVRKMRTTLKIPHIGWNQVQINEKSKLFKNIDTNSYFYFINSYICDPKDTKIISGTTEYETNFPSAFEDKNMFAIQFHPEKSGKMGRQLLANFLEEI